MDIMNVSQQAEIFLIAVISGGALGLVYDILRLPVFVLGNWWRYISDMLFWICASASAFFVIFYFNSGVMRLFEFAGIVLGLIPYFLVLSPVLRKGICKIRKRLIH